MFSSFTDEEFTSRNVSKHRRTDINGFYGIKKGQPADNVAKPGTI